MVIMSVSRAEVISSLQGEERERQWHYTQLELISQKIRNIPLTSAQSVSTPETGDWGEETKLRAQQFALFGVHFKVLTDSFDHSMNKNQQSAMKKA